MEDTNNSEELEDDSIYTKINPDIKARARVYITEAKIIKAEINSMKDLIEFALDEYIINHPHESS